MKATPEPIDGPEAWANFEGLMRAIITVSNEEMQRREAEYRKHVDANPNRRGKKLGSV
jgi:hypothetical protein